MENTIRKFLKEKYKISENIRITNELKSNLCSNIDKYLQIKSEENVLSELNDVMNKNTKNSTFQRKIQKFIKDKERILLMKIEAQTNKLEKKNKKIEDLEKLSSSKTLEVVKLTNNLEIVSEEYKKLLSSTSVQTEEQTNQIENLEKLLSATRVQLVNTQNKNEKLTTFETAIKEFQTAIRELRKEIFYLEKKKKDLQIESSKLIKNIKKNSELRKRNSELEKINIKLEKRSNELEKRNSKLTENSELQKRNNKLERKLEKENSKLETRYGKFYELINYYNHKFLNKKKSYDTQYEILEKEIKKEIKNNNKEILDLRASIKKAKHDLSQERMLNRKLMDEKVELRIQLENKNKETNKPKEF